MEALTRIVHRANGQPYCITECRPAEGWLQTTWLGFVTPADAEQGALAALQPLCQGPVAGLLNDNSQIKGPWFDSITWLKHVWAPQAERLGLRYIAHVAQPHTEDDMEALFERNPFGQSIDLQVFTLPEDAAAWLRDCLHHHAQPAEAPPSNPAKPQVTST